MKTFFHKFKVISWNLDALAVFSVLIQSLFNSHMSKSTLPEELKAGDITSLLKQEDAFSKKSYRPITVLPSVSKIFERLMQNQMLPFVQKFLSPLLRGFERAMAHSMHFCVLQKPVRSR